MKYLKKFFIVFIVFITIFSFSGCSNNINQEIQERLSEVRFNLFEASSDIINVKFSSGFREEPYVLNGKSENKKEFGVITVKFLINITNKTNLPSFVITINEMDFDGEFELNPFDQTYVQDIETFVLDDSNISIKILWNNIDFEGELKNLTNNYNCNHTKALSIFIKEYNKNLKNLLKNDIEFEVYIKIINDPSLEINKNYFYVCLLSISGESFSVVIDPLSCEILAKNESKNQIIL